MPKPDPHVRVTSDGTPWGTEVELDGQPVRYVTAMTWRVDRFTSRLVLEFEHEPQLELEADLRRVTPEKDGSDR